MPVSPSFTSLQDGCAALRALVADYISQAERHDEIPMLVSLLDLATED